MANDLDDPGLDHEPDEDSFVVVFATGKLIQFDMAVDVLKRARIPYQTQEETSTGMKLSMPIAPSPDPGVFWNVLVPEKAMGEARDVLSELPFPIATDPGPWDFLPPVPGPDSRADAREARWLFSLAVLSMTVGLTAYGFATLAAGGKRGDAISSIVVGGMLTGFVALLIWHSRRWAKEHGAADRSPGPTGWVRRPHCADPGPGLVVESDDGERGPTGPAPAGQDIVPECQWTAPPS